MNRNMAKLTACLTATYCGMFLASAWGQETRREFYVLNEKPPSVTVINAETLKIESTIPLELRDDPPTFALLGPGNRQLYVVRKGRDRFGIPVGSGALEIIDIPSRQRLRQIPLGQGRPQAWFSDSSRYFFISQPWHSKEKNWSAFVNVIDTQKNDVVASFVGGSRGGIGLSTKNGSKIFILNPAFKNQPAKLYVFDPANPNVKVEGTPLSKGFMVHMALSRDEKWLYVSNTGPKKKDPGTIHVVDTSSGKIVASHKVANYPSRLIVEDDAQTVLITAETMRPNPTQEEDPLKKRVDLYQFRASELVQTVSNIRGLSHLTKLEETRGWLVAFCYGLRFLSDKGVLDSSLVIALTKDRLPSSSKGLNELKCYEQQIETPAQDKVLVATGNQLAVANLKERQVEHVFSVGRKGVLFRKFLTTTLVSTLLAEPMLLNMDPFFRSFYIPDAAKRAGDEWLSGGKIGHLLTGGPEGKFAYVLNTSSQDVTVINTEDATVTTTVPVGEDEAVLILPSQGRYLCIYSKRKLVFIDTQTNKVRIEHKLPSGQFRGFQVDAQKRRILFSSEDSILPWDDVAGQFLAPIAGLSKPVAIVLSRPD